jgi:hypothetical protein
MTPNNAFERTAASALRLLCALPRDARRSPLNTSVSPAPPINGNGAIMIKLVGETEINPKHRLSCHCGAVVLELDLPNGIVNPRRCDCSMCRRRGAIVASVPLTAIRIVQGVDSIRLYQFNTRTAKHYFCCHCGIYTHHQRRSNPGEYGYNVGCLEGVNPFELGLVPTMDGIHHPADRAR